MAVTFIVGSGRCGSTLVSRLLRRHPVVLSVSEFFAALTVRRDGMPLGELDGAAFWELLSANDAYLDAMVRDGLRAPELTYPYESGRFRPETGVPMISHMTLPMLSQDPDRLFDELAAEVPAWPARPAGQQYTAFFELLADRLGRPVVVERSGASLSLVPELRRHFPGARFVHIHRGGPDCADSMSRHVGFRLTALARQAARLAGVASPAQLNPETMARVPDELVDLLVPPFDARAFHDYRIPAQVFGEMWSEMIIEGCQALRAVPAESRTALSFESLLEDPERELTRLARFLGVAADPAWLTAARAEIDPSRTRGAARLEPAVREALQAACEPGEKTLHAFLG
ncbi:sulfotransferase [Micromonospora sp. KC207]|uniref:sulfotransferase n=1 Tax=Micromonospora sp. KC207 TaxID=2530377 RepID=UPI001404F586|nr:sulfotransferase [Micromonospora sp. KC207]